MVLPLDGVRNLRWANYTPQSTGCQAVASETAHTIGAEQGTAQARRNWSPATVLLLVEGYLPESGYLRAMRRFCNGDWISPLCDLAYGLGEELGYTTLTPFSSL